MKIPRTHLLFSRGVDYHSGPHSFHSTQPQKKSVLCLLTGYLLVLRKGNPTSDTIRGKVKDIFRQQQIIWAYLAREVWAEGRETSKCPAPHFEAWKLVSGAKITGRNKMADTREFVTSLQNFLVTRQFLDSCKVTINAIKPVILTPVHNQNFEIFCIQKNSWRDWKGSNFTKELSIWLYMRMPGFRRVFRQRPQPHRQVEIIPLREINPQN